MDVMYGVLLRGIGEDKICWTPAKSKGFEVNVTIRLCWVYVLNPSLGEVFGSKRFPLELHFLFGL